MSDEHERDENLPGEEVESDRPSDLDAMGLDKRRGVVGGQYGATARKQLTVYGIFLAVAGALTIGFLTVVSSIDNADKPLEDTAPWTQAAAPQSEPRPVDFPNNGPENTIPRDAVADRSDAE